MALVVIVTRDVPYRFRGFLASVMLEIAPAVYISPRMNPGVRSRVWETLSHWFSAELQRGGVRLRRDMIEGGGVGIKTRGEPPRELVEVDGLWLVKRML